MTELAFLGSIACIAMLGAFTGAGVLIPGWQFWPPPTKQSWQYRCFWLLFRVFLLGLVYLCFADFGSAGRYEAWQRVAGAVLAVVGFGLALVITASLGWHDAHGEVGTLKTEGWYGWSRNPVYVVSWLGMAGLGLLVHSLLVWALLAAWAILYLLAPLVEEPWLERAYGEAYRQYCRRVRRFFGRSSLEA